MNSVSKLEQRENLWDWPDLALTASDTNTRDLLTDALAGQLTETFVREAIQNSTDAGNKESNKPVTVDFIFGSVPVSGEIARMVDELNHIRGTCGLPIRTLKTLRWLTVKDSNTIGLTGPLKVDEPDPKNQARFWPFFRDWGRGSKEMGSGQKGKHGIGRISLIYASEFDAILAGTKRQNEQGTAYAGVSLAKGGYHEIESERRRKQQNVYFAKHSLQQPDSMQIYSNEDSIVVDGIFQKLCITRNSPGLSICILQPRQEITAEKIQASVILNYAEAINNKTLIVNIHDNN